jgi:hypothetical protein
MKWLKRAIAVLLVAALLWPVAALPQPEIVLVERRSLAGAELGATEAFTHRLHLTIVNLEGSGWTRERALEALREAAAILGQCGITVAGAEWLTLSAPPRYLDFSTPAARELARRYPVARPAIYLVRDTRSRPAFDAEAVGRGNSRSRPEIADTVWITAATRDAGIVLAHELAHVLMDSGEHSDEPGNLMRDQTAAGNRALSGAQCERLRETGSGNRLLQR